MKLFKRLLLSALSCCSIINVNAKESKPTVQNTYGQISNEKRKIKFGDIAVTVTKWSSILGTAAGLAFVTDKITTGTSVFDVMERKLIKSYIEENFDTIISPYWDVNYFKNGGPNNVKEYLIEIMTDGFIKYNEIFEKDPEINCILAYSLVFHFGFYHLFNGKLVKNGTVVITVIDSHKAELNHSILGKNDKVYKDNLGKRMGHMVNVAVVRRVSEGKSSFLDLPPIVLEVAKDESGHFLCECRKVQKT